MFGSLLVQFVLVSAPVDHCHPCESLMLDVVCACESGLAAFDSWGVLLVSVVDCCMLLVSAHATHIPLAG